MQLLISTPLHLLLVDPFSRQTTCLRSGDGYYYGITAREGRLVLTHTGGYLQYFSRSSGPRRTPSHLIQPHQVEWIEDTLVVANTGLNCLSLYDEKGQFLRDVYLNSIRSDDKEKNRAGNHFNSVHRQGEKVYVVAHNYERPSEVWTLGWPDLNVLGSQPTRAGWAHNIWIGEHGMVICDSRNGGLLEATSGQTLWKSDQQPVMNRGLAVSDDYIFVGRSLHNPRLERYWKDGGVWVLDRSTFKVVDTIDLPGAGDVHEIRLVGAADACHNGEMIHLEDLAPLKRTAPMIQLAYWLRRSFPSLRRNVFPLSQAVRSAQMTRRYLSQLFTGRHDG